MADPFSIGVGIVGVLGLTIQITQIVSKFALDWKNAPKEIKTLKDELVALRVGLTKLDAKILSDPAYEEAFSRGSSAILPHLQGKNSQDSIKLAFEKSQIDLSDAIDSLKIKSSGGTYGWKRLKEAILASKAQDAVSTIRAQYGILDQLLNIDIASLAANTSVDVKQMRKEHQTWHTANRSRQILAWLSQTGFDETHKDILSKAHPGTGQWLLDSDKFKAWRNGQLDTPPYLWCPGIPGAGKSVLTAIVIDHLQHLFDQSDIAVLFIFCDYKNRQNQTDRNLLAALAKQSVLQQRELPSQAKELYDQCHQREGSLALESSIELLRLATNYFRRTFIVIDALDEHFPNDGCEGITEVALLTRLLNLQQQAAGRLAILVTSRDLDYIGNQLRHGTRLEIRANDDDIRAYVSSRITKPFPFAEEIRENPELAHEIIDGVVEKAHGVFLLPRLHLDRLANQTTVRNVRKTLKVLPIKIDETYEDAIVRIRNQVEEHHELAFRVFSWISMAKRPLSVKELQHAVSVELGDQDVEKEDLVSPTLITSVCAGLVSIDSESDTFRLVHYTIEEFFQKRAHTLFPDAEKHIAQTCLTYICFDTFETTIATPWTGYYSLYRYAATFWAEHATLALPEVEPLLENFLGSLNKIESVVQIGSLSSITPVSTGLCLLARGGHTELMKFWIQRRPDVNASDSLGNSPLALAAVGNHLPAVRLLISHGAKVNATNCEGHHALMAFSRKFCSIPLNLLEIPIDRFHLLEIPKLFLESSADVNLKDVSGKTCLHLLAENAPTDRLTYLYPLVGAGVDSTPKDHPKYIDLLLDAGADIDACDLSGFTPLARSIKTGRFDSANLLLGRGAKLNFTTCNGGPPVLMAARSREIFNSARRHSSGRSPDTPVSDSQSAVSLVGVDESPELLRQDGFHLKGATSLGWTIILMDAPSPLASRAMSLLKNAGVDGGPSPDGNLMPMATGLADTEWIRFPPTERYLRTTNTFKCNELGANADHGVQFLLFWGIPETDMEWVIDLFISAEDYARDVRRFIGDVEGSRLRRLLDGTSYT